MKKAPEVVIYCVKCGNNVLVEKPEKVTLKNGRPATRGVCPACGTTVYQFSKVIERGRS